MDNKKCLLSLCIPTNGVTEWVFPVIDSILDQGISQELYEICISDNGTNEAFYLKMQEYITKYKNIRYQRSQTEGFLNQLENFKMASGKFIKFVNHRTVFRKGTLQYLLSVVEDNIETCPVIFFSNGNLPITQEKLETDSFNLYVRNLSYYSSWSGGISFWEKDKEHVLSLSGYNSLFPHTDILFSDKYNSKYIIDNKKIMDELPTDNTKKGRYNLFYAFSVEYLCIILKLLREKFIDYDTFEYVKKKNEKFIVELYYSYIIRKNPASYTFDDYKKHLNVFYSHKIIMLKAMCLVFKSLSIKVKRIFTRGNSDD